MNLNDLENISSHFQNTEKMPVLFLGHGSPMNAIEENQFVQVFRNISKEIPKPNAILCVSAHWFTAGISLLRWKCRKRFTIFMVSRKN